MTTPSLRPIAEVDLAACVEVFYRSTEDLRERRGDPPWPRNEPAMERLFGRLMRSTPAGAWLVEADGQTLGFGIAAERESVWFLGFLFVLPGHQAAGLGRRIMERTLPAVGPAAWCAAGGVLATCVEAVQPVSTGLYATFGLVPRMPVYLLTGRPRPDTLAALPGAVEAVAFESVEQAGGKAALGAALDDLDLSALGQRRPVDHRDDRAEGRQGWLFRERSSGRALGYGYVQPSGRIGPLAAWQEALVEPMLGHLMGALEPAGAWQLVIPGPSAALPALLRAGLRLDGEPAILSATAPYLAGERYLMRSFALP